MPVMGLCTHSLMLGCTHTLNINPSSISLESSVYVYSTNTGFKALAVIVQHNWPVLIFGDRCSFKNAFLYHHTPVHALDLSRMLLNSCVVKFSEANPSCEPTCRLCVFYDGRVLSLCIYMCRALVHISTVIPHV